VHKRSAMHQPRPDNFPVHFAPLMHPTRMRLTVTRLGPG
jgi:hypothetical protein